MRLLLDTHILVWVLSEDSKLPSRALEMLRDQSNASFVSAVTIWEIAIKHALRRGRSEDLVVSGTRALELTRRSRFEMIAVEPEHAAAVDELPHYHGDPFDRLLVVQAMSEGMRLVTHDSRLAAYGDVVMVV